MVGETTLLPTFSPNHKLPNRETYASLFRPSSALHLRSSLNYLLRIDRYYLLTQPNKKVSSEHNLKLGIHSKLRTQSQSVEVVDVKLINALHRLLIEIDGNTLEVKDTTRIHSSDLGDAQSAPTAVKGPSSPV